MKRLATTVLLALAPIALALAKPEVVLVQGDLWLKTQNGGALVRLTSYGHNYAPLVSPDGKRVAFVSEPEYSVKYNRNDKFTNVWLLDLATRKAKRVGGEANSDFARRGYLVWADDSSALAWVKQGKTGGSVAVYNLARGTTATVPFNGNVYLEFSSDGSTEDMSGLTLGWWPQTSSGPGFCATVPTNADSSVSFKSGAYSAAVTAAGKVVMNGCGGG